MQYSFAFYRGHGNIQNVRSVSFGESNAYFVKIGAFGEVIYQKISKRIKLFVILG